MLRKKNNAVSIAALVAACVVMGACDPLGLQTWYGESAVEEFVLDNDTATRTYQIVGGDIEDASIEAASLDLNKSSTFVFVDVMLPGAEGSAVLRVALEAPDVTEREFTYAGNPLRFTLSDRCTEESVPMSGGGFCQMNLTLSHEPGAVIFGEFRARVYTHYRSGTIDEFFEAYTVEVQELE